MNNLTVKINYTINSRPRIRQHNICQSNKQNEQPVGFRDLHNTNIYNYLRIIMSYADISAILQFLCSQNRVQRRLSR
jgi:hypothetical protein